jgi:4-nitrophenyl phosphatase
MCGPGCREELEARGAEMVGSGPADTVVVGFHEEFDYRGLTAGMRAVLDGARILATNDDVSYPSQDGLRPGAGSLLAALVAATGATPEIAGKPFGPMCDLVRELAGEDGVMVGNRPDTDGRFARAMGWRWSLVLSGLITSGDLPVDPSPDTVHDDLLGAVTEHLG